MMSNQLRKMVSIAVVALTSGYVVNASADEKIEGTVVRTKLTQCDMATHRCEGFLDLQAEKSGKGEPTTIRVVATTTIRKGDEKLYLPALRKNTVSISYVTDKGEKIAKAINVLPAAK